MSRYHRHRKGMIALGLLIVGLVGHTAIKNAEGATGSLANSNPAYTAEYAYAAKIFHDGTGQQACLRSLWNQESGWNPGAVETAYTGPGTPTYAYGIPQANPADFGHPYSASDWRAQIRWGKGYIDSRYGTPCNAWAHEEAHNWY